MISTRDRLKQMKEKLVSPLTIHRKPNSKKNGDLEMDDSNDRLTTLEMTVFDLTFTVGELVEQLRLNLTKAFASATWRGRSHRRGHSRKKGVMEVDEDVNNAGIDSDSIDAESLKERPCFVKQTLFDQLGITVTTNNYRSRNKTWKSKLADMKVLMGLSGFGWDSINYTVTANKKVQDALLEVESRKKLKLHKGKKSKDYEVLLELLGDEGSNGDNMRSVGYLIDEEDIADDIKDIADPATTPATSTSSVVSTTGDHTSTQTRRNTPTAKSRGLGLLHMFLIRALM
ncbi:hypothetical protein GIB67_022666 [Kingdonia uniflora]|uniref:Myb/SANT-like domain-containing protein n=1 Tax=Kingdonia uniflora TaxID=39325 RepID=A0A7J7P949_9MAGN|nr:hypothetical protein GIB67_022666 [Kingdonia uniflora]